MQTRCTLMLGLRGMMYTHHMYSMSADDMAVWSILLAVCFALLAVALFAGGVYIHVKGEVDRQDRNLNALLQEIDDAELALGAAPVGGADVEVCVYATLGLPGKITCICEHVECCDVRLSSYAHSSHVMNVYTCFVAITVDPIALTRGRGM